ncbi:DNA internalization-related competence protein ComEC/Rec2 [bacterium]|nr:DNA internalization-related competence protein ComEC/Rec2 [bacterium]
MAKRPVFFLALAFCLGILTQHGCSFSPVFLISAFVLFLFAAVLIMLAGSREFSSLLNSVLLLIACLFSGMLRMYLEKIPARGDLSAWAQDNREILLLGEVKTAAETRRNSRRFLCEARALNAGAGWQPAQGNLLIYFKAQDSIIVSEEIMLRGRLTLPDSGRNPAAFDYRAYLQAQGIGTILYSSDSLLWRAGETPFFSFPALIARAQLWTESQLARFASGQELAMLKGLLIGQRVDISSDVIESFSRTGLIHILSVSGLHVGFIALMLIMLVELCRVPPRGQWPIIIGGLIFYACLTGLQPPIVRATIMAAVLLLGRARELSTNIYNNLGLAALIILLWQPLQLFQISFQLSFAAMFGIAYLYRPLLFVFGRLVPWRWPLVRWALALLAVSIAAQLATLPFTVTSFGRVPFASLWGNLLVIPACFVIVATAAIACFCAPLSGFVSSAFGAVAELLTSGMIAFTKWLATIPLASLASGSAPPLLLLAYLLGLATVVEWRRRIRRLLLPATLLTLNFYIWPVALSVEPKLRLTFFDVGQGDAALLEFPGGKQMLIDAGPRDDSFDAGERILLPYLRVRGISRLAAVIVSHPHADHLGGLPALAQAITIDSVYFCGVEIDSELEQFCERLLDSLNVPRRVLRAGERLRGFDPAQIMALRSGNIHQPEPNVNDASLVIKILFGKTSVLFPGDAESWGEYQMLKHAHALDSDLLKVGHHGSRTSSLPAFLAAVTPDWAVASAGRRNKFGHPDSLIVARYDSLHIPLLRTDLSGAIVFESDGAKLQRVR